MPTRDWPKPQLQEEVQIREAQTYATRQPTYWKVEPDPHFYFPWMVLLHVDGERKSAASKSFASDLPARPKVWIYLREKKE